MRRDVKFAAILVLAAVLAGPAFASGGGGGGSSGGGSGGDGSGSSDKTQGNNSDFKGAVDAIGKKDYTRALKLLQSVVSADPKNADAWNYIGYSDRMLGKYPESQKAYDQALNIKPDHLGANEYLGELYVQTGQTDKAKAQLAKLAKLCGGNKCDEYKELAAAISGNQTALDANGSSKGW